MRKGLLIFLLLVTLGLPLAAAQEELSFGHPISGAITADQQAVRYTFTGEEGENLYASLSTPVEDLWIGIRLLASSGAVLSESEDFPLGSLLLPYALPGTGTYTLEITRFEDSPEQAGDFALFADRVEMMPVTPGEPISGEFTAAGQGAFYTFDAGQGDIYQYAASGNNLSIGLIQPSGFYVTDYNVDDVLTNGFLYLIESGRYTLFIQSADSDGSSYTLRVSQAELQTLTPGDSLSGTMRESAPPLFTFQSEAGGKWALSALVPDAAYAAYMQIFRAGDPFYTVATDSGSGPNGSPRIDPFIAPETDTYYVLLTFDDYSPAEATRDYEVMLAESTVETLSPGAKFDGVVSTDSGSRVYIYNGTAGEQLRITLAKTGGEGWPQFVVNWVNGDLMYFDGYSTSNASFILNLPEEGRYFFTVRNGNTDPSEFQYILSLDQVSN
ncbi:MAG: hypothetical protein H6672_12450 [Anaerolineaceae bacterium]|nr:hypothetical protein [Anaerolineaceae bacterium]